MSHLADITVVIPVFNQLRYTRDCVESLNQAGVSDAQIIVVNNHSTDGTADFLASRPAVRTIHNPENFGCGRAWTQGARLSTTDWTVIMNNDVLVPPGCLQGLVDCAEQKNIDVICPAMCEGPADYDFAQHATGFMQRMKNALRRGTAHGVCFMVHRRVFETIGHFDEDPKLGGYEDDEFFRRARRHRFRLATTGSAFIHHFGSITQNSIKEQSNGVIISLGDREYYRQKTGQTWLKRKACQTRDFLRGIWWQYTERLRYGRTLREQRIAGTVKYL
jgi:GT2 family glycosyltransferase